MKPGQVNSHPPPPDSQLLQPNDTAIQDRKGKSHCLIVQAAYRIASCRQPKVEGNDLGNDAPLCGRFVCMHLPLLLQLPRPGLSGGNTSRAHMDRQRHALVTLHLKCTFHHNFTALLHCRLSFADLPIDPDELE